MSDETGFRPKFKSPCQEETPQMARFSIDMWSKNRLQAASKSSGNIGRYIKTKVKKYGPSVIDSGIGHFGGKVVRNINSQRYKLINVQHGLIIGQTAKYDIKTIGRANFLNKTILNGLGVVATGLTIKQAVEDISEYGLAKGIGRTAVDLSGGIAVAVAVGFLTGGFLPGIGVTMDGLLDLVYHGL